MFSGQIKIIEAGKAHFQRIIKLRKKICLRQMTLTDFQWLVDIYILSIKTIGNKNINIGWQIAGCNIVIL